MIQSNLERSFMTNWRRLGGSHDPVEQYKFARVAIGDNPYPPANPRFRERLAKAGLHDWVLDFAWPASLVAVETNGAVWTNGRHTRGKGFSDDRDKMNSAQLLGWIVLEFTTTMLKDDPERCIAQVSIALRQRE